MEQWTRMRAADFIDFNPRMSIKKGAVATKVAMDKLQPFTKRIPEVEKAAFSGGSKFRNGDTLMARITPCLENGKTAFVDILEKDEVAFGSTEFIVLRAKEGISNPQFIYYLAISPSFRNVAIKSMVGSSGRQRVQQSVLEEFVLKVPSLQEQKKISSVLCALDQKIALNKEINDNLEQQAVALFDNAIQNAESVSYAELSTLADVKGGKRLPKGVNLITIPNSHPYIRVRDLNSTAFASLSPEYEYVDDETQKTISRYVVSQGDVLISIVGTIGLTAIVDSTLNNANLTENCVKLTNLKTITPEYLLLYLRSSKGAEAISKGTVGAVQLKLPIKNIQSILVPLLDELELQSLNDILSAIFSQISANIVENRKLADMRDALLPKLMSGELDVSDIEL